MKKTILLVSILTNLVYISCKKDTTTVTTPAISNKTVRADIMKLSPDSLYIILPYQTLFTFKSDNTWTLNLANAKSNGTYTWTSTDANSAQITFSILQWTPLASDTITSNKLKNVLLAINKCQFPGDSMYSVIFFSQDNNTLFRTAVE